MCAIFHDMRKAALIRQDQGRPRVPTTAGDERNHSIMAVAPDIRIPAPRRPEPQHQPWCSNHIPGVDASDFGTCIAQDLTVGQAYVGLSSTPDGPRIDLGSAAGVLTLDEAERIGFALLCQVARARGADVPDSALEAVAA